MTTVIDHSLQRAIANPMDMIEQVVSNHEWPFDRHGDEELTVGVGGNWCEYHLWFSWREDIASLHFSCAYDMKVPPKRRQALHSLICLINERLWVGHFDLWSEDGMLVFRHALLLRGGRGAAPEQIEDLVETALTEAERFYPAIQFCLWGGKEPQDAIDAAMLETVGEA